MRIGVEALLNEEGLRAAGSGSGADDTVIVEVGTVGIEAGLDAAAAGLHGRNSSGGQCLGDRNIACGICDRIEGFRPIDSGVGLGSFIMPGALE